MMITFFSKYITIIIIFILLSFFISLLSRLVLCFRFVAISLCLTDWLTPVMVLCVPKAEASLTAGDINHKLLPWNLISHKERRSKFIGKAHKRKSYVAWFVLQLTLVIVIDIIILLLLWMIIIKTRFKTLYQFKWTYESTKLSAWIRAWYVNGRMITRRSTQIVGNIMVI